MLTSFALRNGTFGCYNRNQLCWKEKHKDQAIGICGIFYDKQPSEHHLVVAFRDGTIETRNFLTGTFASSGNVTQKIVVDGGLAALFRSNYVSIELDQIIAVRRDGDVIGYNTSWDFLTKKSKKPAKLASLETAKIGAPQLGEIHNEEDELSDLLQRRNILMDKLQSLSSASTKPAGPKKQLMAPDTKIHTLIRFNFENGYPELVLSTKNSTIVHGVVAYSTQLFEKEVVS